MFKLFVFASIVATGYAATTINDKNCTNGAKTDPAFLPSATVCANVFSDAACKSIFGAAVSATDERPTKCFSQDATTVAIDDDLKAFAMATCPKYCSYCCETSDYACDNAAIPRLTCATITSAQCNDMNLREIIAADCPSACGFCNYGGCVDASPSCEVAFCTTRGMENFVANYCKRTCQMCDATTPNPAAATAATAATAGLNFRVRAPGVVTACTLPADNPRCASWVARGFCTNSFYSAAQRRANCPRACNLC